MPSKRERICYFPSINAQETIIKITNKENLNQSKVVEVLVEEALMMRSRSDIQNSNEISRKNPYKRINNTDNSFFNGIDFENLFHKKYKY